MIQSKQIRKGSVLIEKKDEEIAAILNVVQSTVTRWRTKKRFPKFDEVLSYEEKLGLPFECFISREPDLLSIKDKLEQQLKAINKLIKNKKV